MNAQTSFFILAISILAINCYPATADEENEPKTDLLIPLYSTTVLSCSSVFQTVNKTAHWFKNGKQVATVGSEYNAVYMNRSGETENIPEVGFLILKNTQKDDQGLYHCESADEPSITGKIFDLKVAFVDSLPPTGSIYYYPEKPIVGEEFYAHVFMPPAYPKPSVVWLLNGEPIEYISSETSIDSNGTLFIKYLSNLHIGKLECIISNFAAKTSTSKELLPITIAKNNSPSNNIISCGNMVRIKILWFLIGCLVTSLCVLIYLLCVLMILRPNHQRATLRPIQWFQTHPLLAPGFRKVITPTPDILFPRQGGQVSFTEEGGVFVIELNQVPAAPHPLFFIFCITVTHHVHMIPSNNFLITLTVLLSSVYAQELATEACKAALEACENDLECSNRLTPLVAACSTSTCQPQCRNAVLNVYQNKLGRNLLRSDASCIHGREELRTCNFLPTGDQVHCSLAKLACEADLQCNSKWGIFFSECEAETGRGECSPKCAGFLREATSTPHGQAFINCTCTDREDQLCHNLKNNVLNVCNKPTAPSTSVDNNSVIENSNDSMEPSAASTSWPFHIILPTIMMYFLLSASLFLNF
ncbi:unnamed protein product [Auanema sp. JU1783]|nr:unnamed protein product [Auanema sp. JU1783]